MRSVLSLTALLTLAAFASSAPISQSALSDKYLADDTDFVAVVNVKQIVASPAFKKKLQKQLEDLLKMEPAATILKDASLNPLKDVERITLIVGASSFPTEGNGGGPAFLFEGTFDTAKMQAKAEDLAKTFPTILKVKTKGDYKIFEVTPNPVEVLSVVALDKNTIFFTARPGDLDAILEKAAGKKKTTLKNKVLAEHFSKFKADLSVNVVATGEMVMGSSGSVTTDPTGKTIVKRTNHTFAEQGIQLLTVTAEAGDDVTAKANITAKDVESAAKLETQMNAGIRQGIDELTKLGRLPALLEAMKNLKLSRKDGVVTMEAKGDGDAVAEMFMGMFIGRAVPTGPAPAAAPAPPAFIGRKAAVAERP
jgi:hypothetical protein